MKIKVGIKNYNIIHKQEIVEVGGEFFGLHVGNEEEIHIAEKFSQLIQNGTFLHELLHAIAYMQDLRELNNDEHSIELLAKGLHMVILDNPHIFKMVDIAPEKDIKNNPPG